MALLWIVLGVVLVIAEAFTATFVLIMLAAGAFAAAIAAALGAPVILQAATFAVVSALTIWLLRPVIRKQLTPAIDPNKMEGVGALEGAPGVVLDQVTTDHGRVRVGGEMWTARVYDATQVLDPGERIRVIEVRGNTAMVWRDEFGEILEDREANE
jgi:membrane protein implicated in regulation of membrane protease activity